MNFNFPIILGSKSPRRKELLKLAGYSFQVISKEIDETFPEGLEAEKVAEFIALNKVKAFGNDYSDSLIITADTTVIIENRILGKPSSYDEALKMIELLSGNVHKVVTGVALKWKEEIQSFSELTEVEVEEVSEKEAKYYVDNFKPYDKAGAYGIQEWFGVVKIKEIRGDYYNVVGLPVHKIYERMKRFSTTS